MIKTYADEEQKDQCEKKFYVVKSLVYLNNLIKYNHEKNFVDHISVSLNPKQIKKQYFEEFIEDTKNFGQTLLTLNQKFDSVRQFLNDYSEDDQLIQNFLKIIDRSKELNPVKKGVATICRYDYMLDEKEKKFMQIEYNQTAVSMGFHQENTINIVDQFQRSIFNKKYDFVNNNYTQEYSNFVEKVYKKYGNNNACILIYTEKNEGNMFEILQIQRLIQKLNIDCKIINRQGYEKNIFCKKEDKFYYDDKEVAMIFYRSLYDNDHMDELSMEFYAMAESSKCFNVPDVYSALLSLKPLQLLFSSQDLLKKYNLDELQDHTFMKYLTPTYHLKFNFESSKEKMIDFIQEEGKDHWILKTFQEGGYGDILSGQEMIDFINKNSNSKVGSHILVYKIKNADYPSIVYIRDQIQLYQDTISEFGIYYNYLFDYNQQGDYEQEYQSQPCWLLRTKERKTAKGGVSVNASFLDSICYEQ